jgi:hypothetical protein
MNLDPQITQTTQNKTNGLIDEQGPKVWSLNSDRTGTDPNTISSHPLSLICVICGPPPCLVPV